MPQKLLKLRMHRLFWLGISQSCQWEMGKGLADGGTHMGLIFGWYRNSISFYLLSFRISVWIGFDRSIFALYNSA